MIFSWIAFSLVSMAAFEDSLERSDCKKEVSAAIATLKPKENWTEQVPATPDGKTFRAPLSKFPEWVEVRFQRSGPPEWIHLKENETLIYRASDGKCKFESAQIKVAQPKTTAGTRFFTDKDWQKLLASNQKGMVYVWSPGMVYSVEYYGRFQKVAKDLGLKFTAVVDPQTPKKFVDEVAARHRSGFENLRLASLDLQMRNVTNHYPTAVLYNKGKISKVTVVGVMNELDLIARVQNLFTDLSK